MTTEQTTCSNCKTTQTVQSEPLSACIECQALIEKQYTCIVCEPDGTGTHWVQTVTANNLESAKQAAVRACKSDWYGDEEYPGQVHMLAVFQGNVAVLHYEDLAQ